MYKRILVPLDGSGLAERALPHAIAIARAAGSEVVLFRVVTSPLVELTAVDVTSEVREAAWKIAHEEAEEYLAGIRGELQAQGVPARTMIADGPLVAGNIVDFAAQHGVDLIVMSSHGRSGLARWVFGSVAQKVLQRAPCPVVLVPTREERPASPGTPV